MKEQFPYLLNRKQAADFLGIDVKSFDKYIRKHPHLRRFMIGRQERYTVENLKEFISEYTISE